MKIKFYYQNEVKKEQTADQRYQSPYLNKLTYGKKRGHIKTNEQLVRNIRGNIVTNEQLMRNIRDHMPGLRARVCRIVSTY